MKTVNMDKYDIVIIGGATSGAYFAKKMAKKGYSVKIIEALSKRKLGTRMDIFHVSRSDFESFDMPKVQEGDKEWAFEFTDNHFSSPSNKYTVPTTCQTVGLHMHEYVALMVKEAVKAGAEIEYDAKFLNFLFKKNKISGVAYETKDGIKEIGAKVVVDCSGRAAVGRRALPSGYGIEPFALTDEDMFYVILRYAEFPKEPINTFWLHTKSWYAPFSMNKNEKIIGTGATGGFENAQKTFEKLDSSTGDSFNIVRTEKGSTPYRRPPYSLVADNFIVTGDAACLTKPDCGEGVTSSMVMMDIACDVLDLRLKNGETDAKALWKINTEYNRIQGADFCLVRAFLTKLVESVKDEELEYCFEKGLILNGKFLGGEEIKKEDIIETITGVAKGIKDKNITLKTMKSVISGALLGLELKSHYMNFPSSPEDMPLWELKASHLWKKVGKMK